LKGCSCTKVAYRLLQRTIKDKTLQFSFKASLIVYSIWWWKFLLELLLIFQKTYQEKCLSIYFGNLNLLALDVSISKNTYLFLNLISTNGMKFTKSNIFNCSLNCGPIIIVTNFFNYIMTRFFPHYNVLQLIYTYGKKIQIF